MNRAPLVRSPAPAPGVYAAVRASGVAEAAERRRSARPGRRPPSSALRIFRDEVAQGRAEAETELRERMGVALHEAEARRELAAVEAPLIDTEESST